MSRVGKKDLQAVWDYIHELESHGDGLCRMDLREEAELEERAKTALHKWGGGRDVAGL